MFALAPGNSKDTAGGGRSMMAGKRFVDGRSEQRDSRDSWKGPKE